MSSPFLVSTEYFLSVSSRRSLYDLFDMMWTSGSSNGDSPSAGGKRMAGGEEKGDLIREWYIVVSGSNYGQSSYR